MNYEELLDEAYKNIQKPKGSGERFVAPRVKGHFEGKKTRTFSEISFERARGLGTLRRRAFGSEHKSLKFKD